MRVGLDYRPALVNREGIGRYARELVRGLLELEFVDVAGGAFDAAAYRDLSLHLNLPGQIGTRRKWVVHRRQGGAVAAIDAVPGSGVIELAAPVPAGHYAFELRIGGQVRVSQSLILRPLARQRERIVVP